MKRRLVSIADASGWVAVYEEDEGLLERPMRFWVTVVEDDGDVRVLGVDNACEAELPTSESIEITACETVGTFIGYYDRRTDLLTEFLKRLDIVPRAVMPEIEIRLGDAPES